jgi:hypothetical protein
MSTTVTVSNSLQLAAALKAAATATAPETIILEAGTYSKVTMYNYNPKANITVESASSSNKAVVQGLQVSDSSNFTFNNIGFTSAPGQTAPVASSALDTNVNFTNDSFTGPISNSYASAPAEGLYVRTSTNTVVSGSTFQYVQNGVLEESNNNISVSSNNFSNLFGDGIDNAASSNVTLQNNSFTNIHIDSADTQHSDCIQFWTSGQTTAGSNITISGNSYSIGTGAASQGIFMTNQVAGLAYSNVTIENNDLVGTSWNGMTLQDISNALVENNTLQTVSDTGMTSRLTLDGGVSGLIENNRIGQLLNQNGNTATVSGNTTLPSIPLSLAAQALVSGMASLASSASPGATLPVGALPASNGHLASHPVSIPKA